MHRVKDKQSSYNKHNLRYLAVVSITKARIRALINQTVGKNIFLCVLKLIVGKKNPFLINFYDYRSSWEISASIELRKFC